MTSSDGDDNNRLLAEHGADFPVERFNDYGDGIKAVSWL
jgi:hypothetical protein